MTDCMTCSYLDRLLTYNPDAVLRERVLEQQANHDRDVHAEIDDTECPDCLPHSRCLACADDDRFHRELDERCERR